MCESEMSHLIFASLLHPLCNFESTQSDRSDQQLQLFSSDDSCLSECHLHNNHLSVIGGLELNKKYVSPDEFCLVSLHLSIGTTSRAGEFTQCVKTSQFIQEVVSISLASFSF